MRSTRAGASRLGTFLVLVLTVATACDSPKPSPSATPAAPTSSDAAPVKVVGDLGLEACDPGAVMPCEQQAVVLTEPIAASGVALTYSTEWADGRLDRPRWNADSLGLGGWSVDVLQRYDAERGILLGGDGSWRFAAAVDIGDGERAVPAYDGLRYFVFDDAWRHVRTVDSITGTSVLSLTYDDAGRLLTVRGQRGGSPVELTVERGPDGRLEVLLGAGTTRTRVAVGAEGRLNAIGRPDGTALTVTYTERGLVTNWLATGRGIVRYEWDDRGRLASTTDADGVPLTLSREASDGLVVVRISDANNGTATFRSERAGDVLRRTFTDTDGTVTQLDTNADGSTRLVEADGTVTTIGAIAHPRWGPAAPIRTPLVETRPDGTEYRVETTTTMGTGSPDPAGGAWERVVTIGGQRWVDAYDPASRTLTNTDPAGRRSTLELDDLARPTERRIAGEPVVTYAYDGAGLLASRTVGEGSTAATTSFAYDTEAGQATATRPDGTTVTARLDVFGNLRGASTADENVTVAYDPAGAALQVRPGAHPATSFGYSEAGRPTAFIPPVVGDDAWYELTTYTAAGQVATIGDPHGRRVEISYDSAGRATSWAFDRGTSTATYDARSGLLASNVSPDGVTTSFAHAGWVPTGLAWSGPVEGAVNLTVNGLLQPVSQAVAGGSELDFGYDPAGLLTSIGALTIERHPESGLPLRTKLGGVETAFEYDASGRLAATTTTAAGQAALTVRYTRDAMGRVTRVERTDAGGAAAVSVYGYDASGRLARVERDGTSTDYAYDASGNRLVVARGTARTTASYDDRDRLTRQGDRSFRHSPDGTLLERTGPNGTTAYDFDDLGALRTVVLPDGRRIDYVIDAGGRRIGRMVDGRLTDGYLYGVDDSIVAWTDGSGRVVAQFAYGGDGRLALVRRDGRDLLVVTDQVGSPIALVDGQSGEVVERVAYDAWGNVIGGKASTLTPFGFAGGLVDASTGLVHFGARDYDPTTARWTAPDPLRYAGGDPNLYRYARGDPVNLVDPTGLSTCAAAACGVASEQVSLLKPAPGGGRRGVVGGTSGGTSGGGSKSGPYRNSGPGSAPSGGAKRTRGPVSTAGGENDSPLIGFPRPSRPDTSEPDSGTTTVCFSGPCYTPGQGVTGAAPGEGAQLGGCIGICIPASESTGVCIGFCGGNSNQGGFVCIIACGYGEPHIVTADGGSIEFQAAGEFVIARSADGTLAIQGRFETPPNVTTVTRVTALAMQVGGDRVAFYSDRTRPMVVNGQAVERADYGTTLPGGGVVERHGSLAIVTWPDGSELGVNLYGRFMNFGLSPSDAVAASLVGIVGSHDGNRANDLKTRDGVVLDPADTAFRDTLYGPFASSWRITQEESLFDYLPGESTATFQRPEIPTAHASVEGLDAAARTSAEALCRAAGITSDPVLSNCILDVALTGDPSYAGSAATVDASLQRAAVDPLDLGTAVEREQPVSGSLTAGTIERYHFPATAGDIVYLDVDGPCEPTVSWRLVRPSGAIAWFGDACTDLGRQVLAEAGEWRIEVYSDVSAAGPYGFRVRSVPPPTEKSIAPGQSASGTTTAAGEWHRYTLQATAGQVVYLDAEAACDTDLSWRLLRPDGTLSWFGDTCTDLGRRVLEVAGSWVIEVYANDLSTGSYAFRVIGAPASRETSVTVGETVADATRQVGEWHRHRLTAAAGDIVYLDALGDCQPGVSWRLLRPDGSLAWFATTCTDLGRRVLDVAGAWTIEIYADGLESGAYSFRVIGVPAVRLGTISPGRQVSGTIATVGEWHRYTLRAEAGQRIVIDAQGNCVADLWWRLLRPDGSLAYFASTCTDSDARTLDVGGDWAIEVYSDTMATGAYAFTVTSP